MRIFLILIIILSTHVVYSAEYKFIDTNGRHVITVNGKIENNEYGRFKKQLELHSNVDGVLLQSHGGSVEAALKIGQLIKMKKLDTGVETYCSSACFFVFLSGQNRFIYNDSYLAIHRPYKIKNGKVIEDAYGSQVYNQIYSYFSFLNVDSSYIKPLVDLVYETPSNSMHELKPGELMLKFNYYLEPVFS